MHEIRQQAYISCSGLIHMCVIQQLGLCEALKLDNPYTLISIPVFIYGYRNMLQITLFAQTHP